MLNKLYMNKHEKIAYNLLLEEGYKEEEIIYSNKDSPDFILENKEVEVKTAHDNSIIFYDTQLNSLLECRNLFIWVFKDSKLILNIKFGELLGKSEYKGYNLVWKDNKSSENINFKPILINRREDLKELYKVKRMLEDKNQILRVRKIDVIRFLIDFYHDRRDN